MNISRRFFTLILLILLILLFYISLTMGIDNFSLSHAFYGLFEKKQNIETLILQELRFPRTILAIMIGAGLALSGASLQVILRNPLADPTLLGISGWASLGAVCVFYTGIANITILSLPIMSFIGALCATLFLLFFIRNGILGIILAGVSLGLLSTSLLSFILNIVPSPYASYEIMHWLMGSLNHVGLKEVFIAFPGLTVGIGLLLSRARSLDGLILGDDIAHTMGISPKHNHIIIILATALIISSNVAVAGGIGFVGLVVPHMIRLCLGGKPSKILLPSALLGSIFVLGADIIVRLPLRGPELQLGVVLSLLGCPFFLYQIWSLKGRE